MINIPNSISYVNNIDELLDTYLTLDIEPSQTQRSYIKKKINIDIGNEYTCDNCNSKIQSKRAFDLHYTGCSEIYNKLMESGYQSYNELQAEYDSGKSIKSIYDTLNVSASFSLFYNILKSIGIKYSLKESANMENTNKIRESTMLDRYGVKHNMLNGTIFRDQMVNNLKSKYGVENVFQIGYVKDKISKTMIAKYGTEKFSNGRLARGISSISKLNILFFNILDELGIEFEIELKLPQENNKSYYAYDILIGNKIIEINGDYWHANPKIYSSDFIVLKNTSNEKTANYIWEYDKRKINNAINRGYEVKVFWESDIKENKDNVILSIKEYLND